MLQFSVLASFPCPIQQITETWMGLGTWLGLQEDKVGLCELQGHGMAKVSYRPVHCSFRGRFFESSSPVHWIVTANEECGYNICHLCSYPPSALDISVRKSCQYNQVCTCTINVNNNM